MFCILIFCRSRAVTFVSCVQGTSPSILIFKGSLLSTLLFLSLFFLPLSLSIYVPYAYYQAKVSVLLCCHFNVTRHISYYRFISFFDFISFHLPPYTLPFSLPSRFLPISILTNLLHFPSLLQVFRCPWRTERSRKPLCEEWAANSESFVQIDC